MKYTAEQFNNLVDLFKSRELPKTEWTHHAHILVAFWHLSRYNERDALIQVRKAIRDYNSSVGTVNSDSSGYHETLTVFWLKVLRHFLALTTNVSPVDAANAFIAAGNADKNLPLQFYSNEILFSKEARQQWVEPDKMPLSKLPVFVTQPSDVTQHLDFKTPFPHE